MRSWSWEKKSDRRGITVPYMRMVGLVFPVTLNFFKLIVAGYTMYGI